MTDEDDDPPAELVDPGQLRGWLDAHYERAEREDLAPEWDADRMGFWLDCPKADHDHRVHLRPELVVIKTTMLVPRTPNDSATGPAS